MIGMRGLTHLVYHPDVFSSDSVEVDIKSCIISVIELYTHWLANPIHTLQLQYTLQSIIMLSDLFAVVSQIF